jgi:hypothetical protein
MALFINLFQEAAILIKILDCYLIKMKPLWYLVYSIFRELCKYKQWEEFIFFQLGIFFKPYFNGVKTGFKKFPNK